MRGLFSGDSAEAGESSKRVDDGARAESGESAKRVDDGARAEAGESAKQVGDRSDNGASKDDKPQSDATDARPGSALATGVAVFPGLLAPGLGHLALGERGAAARFFVADVAALALLFSGLGSQVASGGAGDVAPSFLLQTNGGIALLSTLWLADIVGSARGSAGWTPPPRPRDSLALSLGYTGLVGSPLAVGHGARTALELRQGRLTLEPSLALLGGGYLDARARASYAIWRPAEGASGLGVVLGAGWQRYADDGFSLGSAELLGDLRLDLGFLSRTLRHSAFVLRLGLGVDAFDWDGRAFDAGDAMARVALELGLALPFSRRFDLELVYRYRKDELPGGAIIPGLFDSFLGFFEAQGRYRLSEQWSLVGGTRIGNGVMPWLALESQLY